MNDEMEPVPNVPPSVCEDGHASYPARYARVRGRGAYVSPAGTGTGACPQCGKPRAILPGEYRAGDDGLVTRAELTA